MNNLEKLGILTAMEKAVKEKKEEIRKECDEALRLAYTEQDVEKIAIKIGGQKVGEHVVTFNKEKLTITNIDILKKFLLENGLADEVTALKYARSDEIVEYFAAHGSPDEYERFTERIITIQDGWEKCLTNNAGILTFLDTGEIVPGVMCCVPSVRGTMVRGCAPDAVLPAIAQAGVDAMGLLE